MLYYEDLEVGYAYGIRAPTEAPFGLHEVTEAAIIRFAGEFDPRPQHLDPVAARDTTFEGLIASGAHVFALWTRLALEAARASEPIAILAGLGSEFRLPSAVRPGDRLDLQVEVIAKRDSASRPENGIVTMRHVMQNQSGTTVFENAATSLVDRAPKS